MGKLFSLKDDAPTPRAKPLGKVKFGRKRIQRHPDAVFREMAERSVRDTELKLDVYEWTIRLYLVNGELRICRVVGNYLTACARRDDLIEVHPDTEKAWMERGNRRL